MSLPRRRGAATERERERTATGRDLLQLAAFAVGDGDYAVDIMRIKEIINPVPMTRVPKSPAFLEGVIELRRAIFPVIDMRKRFDLPAPPPTRATKFVIVAINGAVGGAVGSAVGGAVDGAAAPVAAQKWIVGLIVDAVKEVIRIPRDEVRPAPALALSESARYFSGVCRNRDRIVMILDLDALLSSQERISLAGLAAQPLPIAAAFASTGGANGGKGA